MDVQRVVSCALRNEKVFDEMCKSISQIKCNTTQDLRSKTKLIGDAWEAFCKRYLEYAGFRSVKLLGELGEPDLKQMGMKRQDVGIDIVCADQHGDLVAVQCKFRTRGSITWKDVSTFEALCARTGPWKKHIIMTNCRKIIREGSTNPKDVSITHETFRKLKRHEWLKLTGLGDGHVCGGETVSSSSDVRQLRLSRFMQSDTSAPSS